MKSRLPGAAISSVRGMFDRTHSSPRARPITSASFLPGAGGARPLSFFLSGGWVLPCSPHPRSQLRPRPKRCDHALASACHSCSCLPTPALPPAAWLQISGQCPFGTDRLRYLGACHVLPRHMPCVHVPPHVPSIPTIPPIPSILLTSSAEPAPGTRFVPPRVSPETKEAGICVSLPQAVVNCPVPRAGHAPPTSTLLQSLPPLVSRTATPFNRHSATHPQHPVLVPSGSLPCARRRLRLGCLPSARGHSSPFRAAAICTGLRLPPFLLLAPLRPRVLPSPPTSISLTTCVACSSSPILPSPRHLFPF